MKRRPKGKGLICFGNVTSGEGSNSLAEHLSHVTEV